MAVQSHIESLQERHHELEKQLAELRSGVGNADQEILSIKRRKLELKDRIASLHKQQYS